MERRHGARSGTPGRFAPSDFGEVVGVPDATQRSGAGGRCARVVPYHKHMACRLTLSETYGYLAECAHRSDIHELLGGVVTVGTLIVLLLLPVYGYILYGFWQDDERIRFVLTIASIIAIAIGMYRLPDDFGKPAAVSSNARSVRSPQDRPVDKAEGLSIIRSKCHLECSRYRLTPSECKPFCACAVRQFESLPDKPTKWQLERAQKMIEPNCSHAIRRLHQR